jgi:hypothetical protein
MKLHNYDVKLNSLLFFEQEKKRVINRLYLFLIHSYCTEFQYDENE